MARNANGRRVPDLPPDELEELKQRTEAGEPLRELVAEFGLTGHLSIVKYAQHHGWKRNWIDLEAMELDFRQSILTNSQIAAKYGTTRQAVHQFSVDHGWTRDLAGQIHEEAENRVRLELAQEYDAKIKDLSGELLDEALVKANAEVQATITRHHQTGASVARETAVRLLREMAALAIPPDQLNRFIQMAADAQTQHIDDFEEQEKARNEAIDTFVKLTALPTKSSTIKNLMNALAQAIDVERRVYGIKEEVAENDVTKALRELTNNA